MIIEREMEEVAGRKYGTVYRLLIRGREEETGFREDAITSQTK